MKIARHHGQHAQLQNERQNEQFRVALSGRKPKAHPARGRYIPGGCFDARKADLQAVAPRQAGRFGTQDAVPAQRVRCGI